MSQLVTGEAVALDLREAAVPSRMLAAFIDLVIQGVAFYLLVLAFVLVGTTSESAAYATVILLLVGVFLGYPVVIETLWKGKTVGKAAMGLRVVRDDAGPISFRHAFVRGLVGLFVEKPGVTMFSGGLITSLLNNRGKRLGDLVAGTVVIQERVTGTYSFQAVMPPPLAGWAQTLDLSGLPDDLALSVRSFLSRAGQMSDISRAELGNRLAAAVAQYTSPPPPPGTPGWAYLTAVLAERRRRAEAALPAPQEQTYGYGGQAPPPPTPMPGWAQPAPREQAPRPADPPPPPPPSGGFAPPG